MSAASLQVDFTSRLSTIGLFWTARSLRRLLVRVDPSLGSLSFFPSISIDPTVWRSRQDGARSSFHNLGCLIDVYVSCPSILSSTRMCGKIQPFLSVNPSLAVLYHLCVSSAHHHQYEIGGLYHKVNSNVAFSNASSALTFQAIVILTLPC